MDVGKEGGFFFFPRQTQSMFYTVAFASTKCECVCMSVCIFERVCKSVFCQLLQAQLGLVRGPGN